MLGKLLKYELKSTSRILPILYVAVLVAGLLFGFTLRFAEWTGNAEYTALGITGENTNLVLITVLVLFGTLYGILLVAIQVMTLIAILMRFYKNLLQGEGYLMHTLPVETWKLVTSKLLVAILWEVIALIVSLLSALLIGLSSGMLGYILRELDLVEAFRFVSEQMNLNLALFIFGYVLSFISGILVFYLCMSIGNLANRNKILFSVLAYLGINIALSAVASAFMVFPMLRGIDTMSFHMDHFMIREIITNVIVGIGSFIGTVFILRRHLNLA